MERVSFAQAFKLPEIGYAQDCDMSYIIRDGAYDSSDHPTFYKLGDIVSTYDGFSAKDIISAPYMEEVKTWFRKEHNLLIEPSYAGGNKYKLRFIDLNDEDNDLESDDLSSIVYFHSYEDALKYGIKKAIDIVTNKNLLIRCENCKWNKVTGPCNHDTGVGRHITECFIHKNFKGDV